MRKFIKYIKEQDFVSKLLIMLGLLLLVPLLMLIPYPEDSKYAWNFVLPAIFSVIFGLLFRVKKHDENKLKFWGRNNESVIVVGIWLYALFLGAMPFYLSGQLNFVGSLFETVSGWTTTGLSVMYVEEVPRIFNFYRSYTQLCGGLGIVLMMLIFAGGKSAMELFSAEGHPDKLEPNLRSTAKIMMAIYMGFIIFGIISYMIVGVHWFEAVFYAITAMSTGGFAMHIQSIGYYDSLAVEIITIILMTAGCTNFAILALIFKGKFKKVLKIGELRFFLLIVFILASMIAFGGLIEIHDNLSHGYRIGVFHVISGMAGAGLSTTDLSVWRPDMLMVTIVAMLIGGGAGSTTGAIKYTRIYAMYKSFIFGLKRRFMPERAINEAHIYKNEGKIYLTGKYMEEIGRFIFVYLNLFLLGSYLLTLAGVPFDKALFEFASSIGTVGLSVGVTTPETSSFILIVEIIGMILGRLEIFIILVSILAVINKVFRKGRSL